MAMKPKTKVNEQYSDEMETRNPGIDEDKIDRFRLAYLEKLVVLQEKQIELLNNLLDTMERLAKIDAKHTNRLMEQVEELTEQLNNRDTLKI